MNAVARKQGRKRWIDSTPDNLYHLDSIAVSYPNAKIIHMVRDGRAVALSLAKLDWSGVSTSKFDKALLYSALKWQNSLKYVHNSSIYKSDRYMEIRYEEFVSSPERLLSEICAFLKISAIDNIAITNDASRNLYSTLHTPNTPFADLGAGISTNAVDRWKNVLTDSEKRLLELYIGDTLLEFGYALNCNVPGKAGEVITRELRKLYLLLRHNLKERTLLGRFSATPLEVGMD
jgi:hypothetical protein